MRQMYIPKEKKPTNVVSVNIDIAHVPSKLCKYGAIKNKSQVFDDRRKRKPKYKQNYLDY